MAGSEYGMSFMGYGLDLQRSEGLIKDAVFFCHGADWTNCAQDLLLLRYFRRGMRMPHSLSTVTTGVRIGPGKNAMMKEILQPR